MEWTEAAGVMRLRTAARLELAVACRMQHAHVSASKAQREQRAGGCQPIRAAAQRSVLLLARGNGRRLATQHYTALHGTTRRYTALQGATRHCKALVRDEE